MKHTSYKPIQTLISGERIYGMEPMPDKKMLKIYTSPDKKQFVFWTRGEFASKGGIFSLYYQPAEKGTPVFKKF